MSQLMMLLAGGETGPGLLPPGDLDSKNGISVAISVTEGTVPRTIVLGAPGFAAGAINIYRWNGTIFSFFTTIFSPESPTLTDFGAAVAISDDGTKIVVGAPLNAPGQTGGAAYAFLWNGTTYAQDGTLSLFQPADAHFGARVSISKDGLALAVAAPDDFAGFGAVYPYFYSGGWTPNAGVVIESPSRTDAAFGSYIDLSFDGLQLVVTSPTPAITNPNPNPLVLWYDRTLITNNFVQRHAVNVISGVNSAVFDPAGLITFVAGPTTMITLVPVGGGVWGLQDAVIPAASGNFGIAMSANGTEVVVGSATIDTPVQTTGTISIYAFDVNGDLTFLRTDTSPSGQSFSAFGAAIAVVNLTPHMVIGEPLLDRAFTDMGNAYALAI